MVGSMKTLGSLGNGSRYALVAREMAPLAASPNMYRLNRSAAKRILNFAD